MTRISPNTRIIFLDMDGVMNHIGHMKGPDPIDPECIKRLNEIVEATDAKVVISSTWRKYTSFNTLAGRMTKMGFVGEILDYTPCIEREFGYNAPRGCEIQLWIKRNIADGDCTYRRYIILDDDSDMLLEQRENFILTDATGGGLTINMAHRAKRTLLGLENIPNQFIGDGQ